jgi:hypothetical protein
MPSTSTLEPVLPETILPPPGLADPVPVLVGLLYHLHPPAPFGTADLPSVPT